MQLIIRAAEPDDAEQLVNLIEQVESSGFMLFEPEERKISDEQMKKRIEAVEKEKSSTILIAKDNGGIFGYLFAIGGIERGPSILHTSQLELLKVNVEKV